MNMFLPYTNEVSSIPCAECGGDVIEFTIPNDIWNKIIRPNGIESIKEYLCINCWYDKLREYLGLL